MKKEILPLILKIQIRDSLFNCQLLVVEDCW